MLLKISLFIYRLHCKLASTQWSVCIKKCYKPDGLKNDSLSQRFLKMGCDLQPTFGSQNLYYSRILAFLGCQNCLNSFLWVTSYQTWEPLLQAQQQCYQLLGLSTHFGLISFSLTWEWPVHAKYSVVDFQSQDVPKHWSMWILNNTAGS